MWRILVVFGALAMLLRSTAHNEAESSSALPTIDPRTGHGYLFVASHNISWHYALQSAAKHWKSPTHSSYLATITSKEEEAFIRQQFPHVSDAWIAGSDEDEGIWCWMAGPERGQAFFNTDASEPIEGFVNFAAKEPNNQDNEDFLVWNFQGKGGWNDEKSRASSRIRGYLVEISTKTAAMR